VLGANTTAVQMAAPVRKILDQPMYMYIQAMATEQMLIQHKKILQQAMKELNEFE